MYMWLLLQTVYIPNQPTYFPSAFPDGVASGWEGQPRLLYCHLYIPAPFGGVPHVQKPTVINNLLWSCFFLRVLSIGICLIQLQWALTSRLNCLYVKGLNNNMLTFVINSSQCTLYSEFMQYSLSLFLFYWPNIDLLNSSSVSAVTVSSSQ